MLGRRLTPDFLAGAFLLVISEFFGSAGVKITVGEDVTTHTAIYICTHSKAGVRVHQGDRVSSFVP